MRKITILSVCALILLGIFCRVYAGETVSCQECIAVYGDSQTGSNVHKQIVADIIKLKPGVVFHLGDMVAWGYKEKDWEKFNAITGEFRRSAEFFPVMGNHENESPLYFNNFSLPKDRPWYSLERFGMYFIVLDTNLSLGWWSKQHRWLQSELKLASFSKKPIIIFLHKPLFDIGLHSKDVKGLRRKVVPLFEKYGVAIVFSGHDHNYQRAFRNGIYYVVSGGGGGGLSKKVSSDPEAMKYNQKFLMVHNFCTLSYTDGEIRVKAYDIDMKLIDEFSQKIPRLAGN